MKKAKVLVPIVLASLMVSCGKSQSPNHKLVVGNQSFSVKGTLKSDDIGREGDVPENWFNRHPEFFSVEGTGVDLAYEEFLLAKSGEELIVAVIDSGVDIEHEDLVGKIWENKGEIPGDGIDNDQNGYVDDIHGWNFIGGKDGSHVGPETLEVTRELIRYKARIAAGEQLSTSDIEYFEKVKTEVEEGRKEAKESLDFFVPLQLESHAKQALLKEKLGQEDFSKEALEKIESDDPEVVAAKEKLLELIGITRTLARLDRIVDYYQSSIDYYFNEQWEQKRKEIVGDNPSDFNDNNYGNADVEGPDAGHGTHVAGIIAANRGNLGIDGISTHVKIMAIRAVPNGDERDKDVANAVRYAVDNGAKIINMSFGKSYSPFKAKVDEAFQYAESKGVLIVHAAGNDSADLDKGSNFPNKRIKKESTIELPEVIGNWIEVGASTPFAGLELPASFSNYGKTTVDLFAPGKDIKSTVPQSEYDTYSGTSMASPVVAGVAALVWSKFPELTAAQLRSSLLKYSRPYKGLEVTLPGAGEDEPSVFFSELSIQGTVVDAYETIKNLSNSIF